MRFNRFRDSLAILVALAALVLPANGQLASSTSLVGTVTDSSGGVVAVANVTAVNDATQVSYKGVTNNAGIYNILYVPVGTYTITVESPGFQKAVHSSVIVEANQAVRTDFTMSVGQVSSEIVVSSAPPPFPTDDATITETISQTQVNNLPVNGLDPLKLAITTPGVTLSSDSPQGNPPGERFFGAGTRDIQNDITLDGVTLMNALFMTVNFRPDPSSVQEVNVQSGTYSAEYGNYLGVHVNEVTKSGGNQLHGSFSEFLGNTILNANTYDFSSKPIAKAPFHLNQFNTELDGPIVIPHVYDGRNKTFFMFDYQGLRQNTSPSNTYTVMTPLMRNGNFTEITGSKLTDKYNPGAITGNVIAPSDLSPVAQAFLQVIPQANVRSASTASGYALTSNFVTPVPSINNLDQYIGRIDENINSKTRLFFRYAYESASPEVGAAFPNDATVSPNYNSNFVVDYTQVISPSLINDVHVGRNDFHVSTVSPYYTNKSVDTLAQTLDGLIPGFAYIPADPGIPLMSITGITGAGNGGTNWFQGDTTWSIDENLSWTHGSHNIVAGFDLSHFHTTRLAANNAQGYFDFTGAVSGNAAADFMLGMPLTDTTVTPEVEGSGAQWRDGFYVQDKWDITRKLTLNLGFRYEYYTAPVSPTGYANVLNPAGTQLIPTTIPTANFALVQPYHLTPAPRFGFAYRLTNAWVFRGGFGIYYNPDQTNVYTLLATNPPEGTTFTYNTSATTQLSFANPTPSSAAAPKPPPNIVTLPPFFPPATMNQWSFDVERTLWANAGLDVQYIGNHTDHLDTSWYNNTPLPGPGSIQANRPNQLWGVIRTLDNQAWSNYDALNVVLTQRFHSGLNFSLAYTWSHALDVATSANEGGQPANPYNFEADYGNALWNIPQRFVANFSYQLPFFNKTTNGLVRNVAAGWILSGIFATQSGMPFNVVASGDPANTGRSGQERPNLVSAPSENCGSKLVACVNTAAFAAPAPYTYGNAGRDILSGPGLTNLDASLSKNFRFGERVTFQFRAEAFNAFNHPNFANPSATFGTSTFGNITALNGNAPMRQFQFAGRLFF
ncbi:MAG TPA: carboxypeptidase regulatory-like domain-containing protein [Bryobacteraceae bacterium]|nr:carboxypeptidase regulatory-like domain-containing protein [Bryobacteraceae bacterium]